MSRSYRKPYTAITGVSSAHHDKKIAARGLRRKQDAWLRDLCDFDSALAPHRLECNFNDTWSWSRDGSQFLTFPDSRYGDDVDHTLNYWIKLHRK